MTVWKYFASTASTFAAIFSGRPARLAIAMARSGPFSRRDAAKEGKIGGRLGRGAEGVGAGCGPMRDRGQPVRLWQRCTLVVGDGDQRIVAPAGIGFWQVFEIEPAVQCGHGWNRHLRKEREMEEIQVEMHDVELDAALVRLVRHREMRRKIGLEGEALRRMA